MNSVTGATVHKAENIDVILYHYSWSEKVLYFDAPLPLKKACSKKL